MTLLFCHAATSASPSKDCLHLFAGPYCSKTIIGLDFLAITQLAMFIFFFSKLPLKLCVLRIAYAIEDMLIGRLIRWAVWLWELFCSLPITACILVNLERRPFMSNVNQRWKIH